ncbi:MAG TPA: dihydroneopterin aldolase [Spirochaetia bacterium]|nr:dihydroneopterin aldolase [Spirochaetia bacterium]
MDRLIIRDLRVPCIIGARERERSAPQDVLISVFLGLDLRPAGRSDSLELAVDYSALVKKIVARVEESRFFLVEALAEAVADTCLSEPGARRVKVRVGKPAAARHARIIEVELIRERTR